MLPNQIGERGGKSLCCVMVRETKSKQLCSFCNCGRKKMRKASRRRRSRREEGWKKRAREGGREGGRKGGG